MDVLCNSAVISPGNNQVDDGLKPLSLMQIEKKPTSTPFQKETKTEHNMV